MQVRLKACLVSCFIELIPFSQRVRDALLLQSECPVTMAAIMVSGEGEEGDCRGTGPFWSGTQRGTACYRSSPAHWLPMVITLHHGGETVEEGPLTRGDPWPLRSAPGPMSSIPRATMACLSLTMETGIEGVRTNVHWFNWSVRRLIWFL